jgi:flagellar motor protein MotB
MRYLCTLGALVLLPAGEPLLAQTPGKQPLYRVTIVSRTTKALNYGYLTTPTRIGFAPTPLLMGAEGEATVEPGRGATQIRARFSNVPPAQRFGAGYLTYVLWAISPDGRAHNLGELMLDASNKARLNTSAPLQTFALIVTAEPYYSVTQPSNVVVMENVVVPGTVGKVEEVNATFELLPRKEFTWDSAAKPAAAGKPVSKAEYDAMLALYQAQNAIQIAEAADAQRHAPEPLARARQLYEQARGYPVHLSKEIVAMAREAAQIAEDSRAVAVKRAEAERAAAERVTETAPPTPPAAHVPAPVENDSQRSRIEPTRVAPPSPTPAPVEQRVAPAPAAVAPAAEPKPPIEVDPRQFSHSTAQAAQNRRVLLSRLQGTFPVTDTPRGLVITLPEIVTTSAALPAHLRRVASAIAPYKDVRIEVEGHSDREGDVSGTERRAESVRAALITAGVPAAVVMARGVGNERPRASNATASGRAQNRRIEIVIAGDAIGSVPTWGRTYSLSPAQSRR